MPTQPNAAALRTFITDCFNRAELTLFCNDHFAEVSRDHAENGTQLQAYSEALVGYCTRRGMVDALCVALHKERPRRWEREFGDKPADVGAELAQLRDKVAALESENKRLRADLEALKAGQTAPAQTMRVWITAALQAEAGLAREGFANVQAYDPAQIGAQAVGVGGGVIVYPANTAQEIAQFKHALIQHGQVELARVGLVVYKEGDRIDGAGEAVKGFGAASFANFPASIAQQVKNVAGRLTANTVK